LIDALKDADYEVRYYVATALSAIGGDAVDPLIQALEDKLATTRSAAAYALGQLGAVAAPATAALLKALKDTDTDVRRNAALALGVDLQKLLADRLEQSGRWGSPEAMSGLQADLNRMLQQLRSGDPRAQADTQQQLQQLLQNNAGLRERLAEFARNNPELLD